MVWNMLLSDDDDRTYTCTHAVDPEDMDDDELAKTVEVIRDGASSLVEYVNDLKTKLHQAKTYAYEADMMLRVQAEELKKLRSHTKTMQDLLLWSMFTLAKGQNPATEERRSEQVSNRILNVIRKLGI